MPRRFVPLSARRARLVFARLRPGASWTLRLTLGSAMSFAAARWLWPNSVPLLAPLTTLLVIQVTVSGVFRHSIDRVASVVVGVGIAIAFTHFVRLDTLTLALLIASSLSVGQLLRLGPNLLEVPISAMLVLGVSAGTTYVFAATDRVLETLVGAGIGLSFNLFLPPGERSPNAGRAVADFAGRVERFLKQAAEQCHGGLPDPATANEWLGIARDFSNHTPDADKALTHAEESRRLNLRALGTADNGPALRACLDGLEHSSVAIRSMARSIHDASISPGLNDELGPLIAPLLSQMATAVAAMGQLALLLTTPSPFHVTRRDNTLLKMARDVVAEELALSHLNSPTSRELLVYVIATADRLLVELDFDTVAAASAAIRPPN